MIDIKLFDNKHFTVFLFEKDKNVQTVSKEYTCGYCKFWYISENHVIIINQLKEAGLLPEDYPIMCCECYAKSIGKIASDQEIDREWLY